MPVTVDPTTLPPAPEATPRRVRWKRQQCAAMREAGILTGRYELVDGEIISKMGQNPPHLLVVRRVLAWLVRVFGADFVAIQATLDISAAVSDFDEPEPDAYVTSSPAIEFGERLPRASDVALLIEVSDTSLNFDLTKKAVRYAAAGIVDYWVIDVSGRQLYVHRSPSANGYMDIKVYGSTEGVTPLSRPDNEIIVAELLPPTDRE